MMIPSNFTLISLGAGHAKIPLSKGEFLDIKGFPKWSEWRDSNSPLFLYLSVFVASGVQVVCRNIRCIGRCTIIHINVG